MDKKTFKLEIKELLETGEFTGYASIYGIVDLQNEVVDNGAFTRTLQHKQNKVFFLDGHDPDKRIGVAYLEDTGIGLKVKGILNLAKVNAREVYEDIKFYLGHSLPLGMSIGFKTIKDNWEGTTRHLKELNLFEISCVTLPALEPALITEVKENEEMIPPEGKPEGGRGWDETETSWRYRVRDPSLFISDSFRTVKITDGVSSVMGKLESDGADGSMIIQSVIFSKNKFSGKSDAQKWLKDHEDIAKSKKSQDFNQNFEVIQEQRELFNRQYTIDEAFQQVINEVLYPVLNDKTIPEKLSILEKALDDHKREYLKWASDFLNYFSSKSIEPLEIKSGRMLSAANIIKLKEAMTTIQALLDLAELKPDSAEDHSDDEKAIEDSADIKSDSETSLRDFLSTLHDLKADALKR